MSSFDTDPELAQKLHLSLDSQAGPATRISKDRAKELVRAALSALPEQPASVASSTSQKAAAEPVIRGAAKPDAVPKRRVPMLATAAAILFAFISGASASLWVWANRAAEDAPLAAAVQKVHAPISSQAVATREPKIATHESQVTPAPPTHEPAKKRADSLPEDLLQQANRLRAEGSLIQARDRYEQVARRYPGTLSAYAAQVAVGSLELEHLARPDAARRWFERALLSRPNGALSLEALEGLAASHGALGHARKEAEALRRLVAAYPQTLAAKRSRARLTELGTGP